MGRESSLLLGNNSEAGRHSEALWSRTGLDRWLRLFDPDAESLPDTSAKFQVQRALLGQSLGLLLAFAASLCRP